jgi:class 3 adenylate cyclase
MNIIATHPPIPIRERNPNIPKPLATVIDQALREEEVPHDPVKISSKLIFLKCTGDGFLSVFESVPAAFALASTFLETPVHPSIQVRMALHWGTVKTGPKGDVLGKEVHRACRIEGVKKEDVVEPALHHEVLPDADRILLTSQGLARLTDADRARCRPIGKFRLKGFNELCELWLCSS